MFTVTEQSTDIAALRELLAAFSEPPLLHAGHLANTDHSCECAYIFDEVHLGGVGQVFIDNGKAVSEGGNDAPSKELATAYLKLIVGAVNALPALLDKAEGK